MNARQKAKKYKKELDILKGQTVPFKIEKTKEKIITLGAEEQYPLVHLAKLPPYIVTESLLKKLIGSDKFRQAVKLDNFYEEKTDSMKFTANLRVVIPTKED